MIAKSLIVNVLVCDMILSSRRLKIILLFLFFVDGVVAQNSIDFIERVQNYQKSVRIKQTGKFPDTIDTTTFNLNMYLQYFDKLNFPSGFKFNYVFYDDRTGGQPILYAKNDSVNLDGYIEQRFLVRIDRDNIDRNKITKEFEGFAKYQILCGFAEMNPARYYIKPEDTEIGYLQYLFFNQFGEQFALKWHSNYGQKSVIFSENEMKRLFSFYSRTNDFSCKIEDFEKLLKINPTPVIEMGRDKCLITWYEIRTHLGIHKLTYEISRLSPYRITKKEDIELLKINTEFIY